MIQETGAHYRIEALAPGHDRCTFSCGVPELDIYIRERASQDAKRHLASTFVLVRDSPSVLGYYSLSQQIISLADVPSALAKRLPGYPLLPATLVGRLAISGEWQSRGLGRLLLIDALRRSWTAASEVASFAVRVDATNEKARDFYVQHGFLALPNDGLKLFIPMVELDRLFEEEPADAEEPA